MFLYKHPSQSRILGFEAGAVFCPKAAYRETEKLMKGGVQNVIPRQSIQCANGSKEHRS